MPGPVLLMQFDATHLIQFIKSLRPSDAYTIISSDNGLSPGWCQAIIWTNAVLLLIESLGTNVNQELSKFKYFHSRKWIWKRVKYVGHFVFVSMF